MMNRRSVVLGMFGFALLPRLSQAAKTTVRSYVYYEGERAITIYLDPSEIAEVTGGVVKLSKVQDAKVSAQLSKGVLPASMQGQYAPVFRTAKWGGRKMTLPGGVIVYLQKDWKQPQADAFLKEQKLEVVKVVNQERNAYLVASAPGFPSLELADKLRQTKGVEIAKPLVWQESQKR